MSFEKILFDTTKELTRLHIKLGKDFNRIKDKSIDIVKKAMEEAAKEAEESGKKKKKPAGK